MKNIFYKPGDGWVGDTIPFAHDGKFYIFYLHDERKGNTEDEYGYRTSWNLLITEDGVNIKDCKVVLPVGGYDDADYACYTGSVIEEMTLNSICFIQHRIIIILNITETEDLYNMLRMQ